MFPIPRSYFLTSGVGVHRERLTAFELALRDADIEQQNLVSVSSILPPRCEQVERENGVATLRPGEITFCVMARTETEEPAFAFIQVLDWQVPSRLDSHLSW